MVEEATDYTNLIFLQELWPCLHSVLSPPEIISTFFYPDYVNEEAQIPRASPSSTLNVIEHSLLLHISLYHLAIPNF